MKKSSIPWIVAAVLVFIIAGGGYWYVKMKNATNAANNNLIMGQAKIGTVTKKINATGTIQIPTQYNLSYNVKSKITQVNVAAGDIVKAGQVLAQLDNTVANQQILQAKTSLANAQAKLVQVKNGATQIELLSAEKSLKASQNNLANIQQALNAVKNAPSIEVARLIDQSLKNYATLPEAIAAEERAVSLAQTDVELSQAQLDAKKAGAATTDIQSAQATVEQANSNLAIAQAALSDYTLIAPSDGTIVTVNGKVGEYPSSSGTGTSAAASAFIIMEASSPDVQIIVPADEADIGYLKAEQSVDLTLPAYQDRKFTGYVTRVSTIGKTQNNVTTFEVTITAKNVNNLMKAGMSANVAIIIAQKQNVLTVVSEALRGSGNQKWVMTPPPQGSTITGHANVQIGLDDGSQAEVLSGLQAGQEIVTGVRTTAQSNTGSNPFSMGGGLRTNSNRSGNTGASGR